MNFLKGIGKFVLQLIRFVVAICCYIIGIYQTVLNPSTDNSWVIFGVVVFVFGVLLYWRFWIWASVGAIAGYALMRNK